jgi:hypothetical protein
VPSGTYATGALNTTAGQPSFALDIPASNDPDISPTGWQATIKITFADSSAAETYVIPIPISAVTTGIDLIGVTLPQNLPPPTPVLIKGIPGGIAGLDTDGDVNDARGNKILGGGSGGGGGSGTGSVDSVDGVGPDTFGNVPLRVIDLPDVTTLGANLATSTSQANARTTLGLGSSAVQPSTAYDAAGAATTAQTTAQASSAQRASNLTDLTNKSAALSTLGGVSTSDSRLNDPRKPIAADWSARAFVKDELTVSAGQLYRANTNHTGSGSIDLTKFDAIGGAVTLATALPGVQFNVYWDGTAWKYPSGGATISARPTARTDLTMMLIDTIGTAVRPSWAVAGLDLLIQAVA